MSAVVGIDLGTSNSVVAWEDEVGNVSVLADAQGQRIHPSVVSFAKQGGVVGGVLVGVEAKALKVVDPANTIYSFKRLMGQSASSLAVRQARSRVPFTIGEGPDGMPVVETQSGAFTAVELSAIMLDHMREVASTRLQRPVEHAVITVPASFNDAQRSATASAGAIAGLQVVRVLNEPTAAALAYGSSRRLDEVIAVYDFGGGTFDATILRLENQLYTVLGTAGDSFLGGDDIDERLVDTMVAHVRDRSRVDLRDDVLAMMRLRAVAERLKIALSTQPSAAIQIPEIARHKGRPVPLEFEIVGPEFIDLIKDLVDRTMSVTRDALSVAQVTTSHISDVILVGGTTQIPFVRNRVSALFSMAARTDVSPEDAVAIGAALQAASLEQRLVRNPAASIGVPFQTVEPTAPDPSGFMAGEAPQPPASASLDRMFSELGPSVPPSWSLDGTPEGWPLPDEEIDVEVGDLQVSPPPVPQRPSVIDVTPSSLGIGTVGGFCEPVIERNSPVPIAIRRMFGTGRDNQRTVTIVVCQGENRRLEHNTVLGDVRLELPLRAGRIDIEVTFELDGSGMLQVSARDAATGQVQRVELDLVGRLDEAEISAARGRMQQLRR